MPKDKFISVGAEVRPGHSDQTSSPSARGLLARRARFDAPKRPLSPVLRRVLIFTWLSLFFMGIYAASIGAAIFQPGYSTLDRIFSGFLVFGLFFISFHGIGYANSMLKASWGYGETKNRLFSSSFGPKVTCIIASYNEPAEVLEETIGAVLALDYANKSVVLLDDSTKTESRDAAKQIAEKYGIECRQRTTRRGYKAGAINDYLQEAPAEYLAVFDADALPAHNFLSDVLPRIAENPRLAFIQTPQFYANTEASNVALGASRQQNVFYEYICEGKSYSKAMFCCGTNVIFRRAALLDVGGFDETNVTEDFATSFLMHHKGWDSLYLNRVYAYSLAPETLASYFVQQSRWSFGTTTSARFFLKKFLQNPFKMRAGQWWEYFLSSTYYWIGPVNLLFMLLPLGYLFFGIRPLRQDTGSYVAVFLPYFLFTMNMFYVGMDARGYKPGEMILGQQIAFVCFPTHIASCLSGLIGRKRPFALTPKGLSGRVSWISLWPQILMLILSALAFCWGMFQWFSGRDRNTTAVLVNSAWALYHVWMLGSIAKLNQPARLGQGKSFFQKPDEAPQGFTGPLEQAPARVGRHFGFPLGAVTLGLAAWVGFVVAGWNLKPAIPVNVAVLDRTVGQNGNQHRALYWALNFLKVEKQPAFGPNGAQKRRTYSAFYDYYGFVPDENSKPRLEILPGQKKALPNADLVAFGRNRPLPRNFSLPGVVYLADTYGEFSSYNSRAGRNVKQRSQPRGLTPDEIERLGAFARHGGLLMGEWNVLGYPTRPGAFAPAEQVEQTITLSYKRLGLATGRNYYVARLRWREAQRAGNPAAILEARRKLETERIGLFRIKNFIRDLQIYRDRLAITAAQVAAQKRLERLLHVSAVGWTGRYVERFENERENDYPMWKSLRDELTRQNKGRETLPSGPGFVFYPDGPSLVWDKKSASLVPHSNAPIPILGRELATSPGQIATLAKTSKAPFNSDPILQNVAASSPLRTWFECVQPAPGSRVLAYTKLQVEPQSAERLLAAGFPSKYLSPDRRQIVFPALIAWRDGNQNNGALRSLYFAGDANNIPPLSSFSEKYPATGGLSAALSARFGTYGDQYFWNYYQPILKNVLEGEKRLRYGP